MANKKMGFLLSTLMISMIISSICSGIAGASTEDNYFPSFEPKSSSGWYNLSTSLTSSIPDVNINFSRNGVNRTFTMAQIVNYTSFENQSFPLVNYTIEKDGTNHEIVGFNPVYLMEIAGWTDVFNFTVEAIDGWKSQLNISQLLLADGEFVKEPNTVNETIIIIVWGGQWLSDYKESYGHFYTWGENVEGSQKVKGISTIIYDNPWTIKIFVDDVEEATLSSLNGTTSTIGNYTTYKWGYSDNESGRIWDDRDCTGYTIASLLQHTSVGDQNYTISFISYDGYAGKKAFTKTQIEEGYTGFMVNDPAEELSNEGKQIMLMSQQDGKDLGFSRGPYQLIIPGYEKGSYIGGILEIKITITNYTNTDNGSKIPGFSIGFLGLTATFAIIAVIKRRK
ncbi:Loki-CTERM sorting domain-containing protein [Candidatus Lokiarchaeum ossiferum]|uniref:Loki-CTERM sorting domain-containing protein n=1 Tax=Candidatus Lokiarchaeum ossiferum TaxID=2951803 RepID=UPI00352FC414